MFGFLDSQTIDDVGEFVDGIAGIWGQIECSDAERVILVSLAIACTMGLAKQTGSQAHSAAATPPTSGSRLHVIGIFFGITHAGGSCNGISPHGQSRVKELRSRGT